MAPLTTIPMCATASVAAEIGLSRVAASRRISRQPLHCGVSRNLGWAPRKCLAFPYLMMKRRRFARGHLQHAQDEGANRTENDNWYASWRPWRVNGIDNNTFGDHEGFGDLIEESETLPAFTDSLSCVGFEFPHRESSAEVMRVGEMERRVPGLCFCQMCGRRAMMASLGGILVGSSPVQQTTASDFESIDYNMIREKTHPARSAWYEEFYAQAMALTMVSYEAELADYKRQLFKTLDERAEQILELGIGTGPNLKFYGKVPHLQRVVGVDPNLHMAKYCTEAASKAGLPNFEFFHAVGEGIPLHDESMDAVVCTLVLCSVKDVPATLQEVKRVLKPGGVFLFVEHVSAPEDSGLRFWQGLFDPLQQWVADGCHLTRNTLQYIEGAQFDSVQSRKFNVASVSILSPHILGAAYK